MLTITKLKMWKDPGYTRQCVEVPPVGSKKLPLPDYVSSEPLRPRRGALLNAVELPLSYLEVHDMSYLYMEISDGQQTPNTMSVFGWILSVEETASSSEAVVIRWTPDYWRTYSASATFGKGTVTRCANDSYKRPFLTQPRRWDAKKFVNPFGASGQYAFILMASESVAQNILYEFPPGSGNTYPVRVGTETSFSYYWETLGYNFGSNTRTPTLEEMFSGRIDEMLPNVIPESIIGCWIVPYGIISGSLFSDTTQVTKTYGGATIRVNKSKGLRSASPAIVTGLTNLVDVGSDDMKKCIAVDPFGNETGMLPWGMKFTSSTVYTMTNITPEGITFYVFPEADFWNEMVEGYYLSFNAISVPVNSNAWSEYVYSGKREYEKRTAEIQRNQQAVAGYAGTGQSLVGGAIAGATKGSIAGALGGAVAGGISSIIGTTAGYFAQGYFNDEIQRETDKLVANQVSNLLMPGESPIFTQMVGNWNIVQLEADAVSLAEYTAKISNDGYTVEIPVGTPSAFLTAGGPLQIQNLVLTGSIPPEAKTYIKNILSNGVRIVENNPSGVVP